MARACQWALASPHCASTASPSAAPRPRKLPDRGITIRALTSADVEAYRAIRLEALRLEPEAYASSYQEESSRPEIFRERLEGKLGGTTFGAFAAEEIVGTAGGVREDRLKTRHNRLALCMNASACGSTG